MSANQKIILTIFVIYLALNAIIGIVFSKRQGSKQNVSSEKKFFIGERSSSGYDNNGNLHFGKFLYFRARCGRAYLWICPGMDCHGAGSGYFFSFRCTW